MDSREGDLTEEDDERMLDLLKRTREATGMTLDFLADLTDGLSYNFAAILCGRSFLFP